MPNDTGHIANPNLFPLNIIGLLYLFALLFPHNYSYGQEFDDVFNTQVSLERQRTTVYQALNQLSDSIGYLFAYDSKVVNSDRRIRVNITKQPLFAALKQILSDSTLSFKLIERHILIHINPEFATTMEKEEGKESETFFTIRGRVVDSQTLQPLAYATVGIPEYSLGNITNLEGMFLLKIPKNTSATSIVVTHIGYKSKKIPISLMQFNPIDIFLGTEYISIQEVIIRNIEPKQLIKEALSRISQNYSSKPVYLTTFYREGVVKNMKYQNYSEAIFRIYKSEYSKGHESDQVKLLKSRKTQNVEPSDTISVKLRGGVNSSLALDIVKNYPSFLNEEFWDLYNFSRKDIVTIGDRTAYEIAFDQNNLSTDPLFIGVLFIDMDNLAILGADFEINPAHISDITDQYVFKKNRRYRLKPVSIKYSVRYNNLNGTYFLSHVRGDLNFRYRFRRSIFYHPFHLFFELAATQIDTVNVSKLSRRELVPTQKIFLENNYEYDEDFWRDFNIIPPEQNVFGALKDLKAKIEEIQ